MTKGSDYFLSLDAKSKQRYKVKTNKIQRYGYPYQIKKEELSGDISKFPPMQWHNLNNFLFSTSLMNKEELEAHESLKSYNQFASRWVSIICWNCFGYWTGQYLIYFLLYSTVRCWLGTLRLLLRLKSWSARVASRHPGFIGNFPSINHKW